MAGLSGRARLEGGKDTQIRRGRAPDDAVSGVLAHRRAATESAALFTARAALLRRAWRAMAAHCAQRRRKSLLAPEVARRGEAAALRRAVDVWVCWCVRRWEARQELCRAVLVAWHHHTALSLRVAVFHLRRLVTLGCSILSEWSRAAGGAARQRRRLRAAAFREWRAIAARNASLEERLVVFLMESYELCMAKAFSALKGAKAERLARSRLVAAEARKMGLQGPAHAPTPPPPPPLEQRLRGRQGETGQGGKATMGSGGTQIERHCREKAGRGGRVGWPGVRAACTCQGEALHRSYASQSSM